MSVAIIDTLSRGSSGLGNFALTKQDDVQVAYKVVGTTTDRDNLPAWARKAHMICHVMADGKEYQLGLDETVAGQVWTLKDYGIPAGVVTESELFDTNGYIKPQYIQNIFLNTNFVVPDQPSMLALTTFTGNFVIRTDTGQVFIKLNNTNPASLSDFALATPSASVVSVNGQTGVVNVTIANLLSNGTNLTDFNNAVTANSTVASHTASISSLTTGLSTTNTNLSNLSTYVDGHLGGKDLDSTVTSPSLAQDEFALVWNNALNRYKLTPISGGGGGGATIFTALTDVPASYSGQALKGVRVNIAETGLEFYTVAFTLAGLTDVNLSSISDSQLLQYRTSDNKWHNFSMSGDVTISNTGVASVGWSNGYTTYDARYLKLSGGTMTGNLILNADPISSLGAATKNYVDNLITGLSWKTAAQVATTVNITLSGLQTIDGYTTLIGDRVLVKNQSTQTQNGLYIAAIGSWTRSNDADTGTELLGSTVYIENGTVYGGTQWSNNNSSITLGSTNITFVQIAGAGVYTNGSGLSLTGNVFSISSGGVVNTMIANGTIDLTAKVTGILPIANGGTGSTVGAWLLSGTSNLSAAVTVNGNFSGNQFTSTWTATANNQIAWLHNGTLTSRATASDAIVYKKIQPTFNLSSTSIDAVGLMVDASFVGSGGVSTLAFYSGSTNTVAGMTAGSYTVSASSTSGSGTSATFDVVVATATTFTSIVVHSGSAGSGYAVGDTLTFNGSLFGSGSGSVVYTIQSITSQTLGTGSAVLRLKHNMASAWNRRYIDFQDSTGISRGSIEIQNITNGRINFTINDSSGVMWQSDGSNITTSRTLAFSSAALTVASLTAQNFITASSQITAGQVGGNFADYSNSAFKHSATASYTSLITNPTFFSYYSASLLPIGVINTVTFSGTGTTGTYTNIALSGGTGTGAIANSVVVSGGSVSNGSSSYGNQRGTGYSAGDVLTGTIPGGTVTVTVGTINYGNGVAGALTWQPSQSGASSSYNFFGFYAKPTWNFTGSYSGITAAIYYDPTITSHTGKNYSFVSTAASSLGGVGTNNPLATWQINGSGSNPALKTVGAGTSTNLSWVAYKSDGTTLIRALTDAGNFYGAAGSTAMTDGFIYIPAAAGVPSGTPTSISGTVPMYYDTTNNNLYIYNGAWKKVLLT